ncbi:MAG TPA: TetR/AcrR family transcriptional regulator [Micromonosporaceae bacterium]|nr:TetR/AcrR family transcriptional regulator [Micromonosporaceae bacterium]
MPAHGEVEGVDDAAIADLDRAWAEIRPDVVRRLMVAATQEFATRGYHGTATRDIAARAGLSPAGVYVHFKSKEELLYRISLIGHRHALAHIRDAVDGIDEPVERLRHMVSAFSSWHARWHLPTRVIQYEIGALADAHYAEIAAIRREIDAVVRQTLDHGVARGIFDIPDVAGAALALLSLSVDVARWYRPSGPRSPEDIGRLHADLAVRMFRA